MSLNFHFLCINNDLWSFGIYFSIFLGLSFYWFLSWNLTCIGCLNDFALLHASLFGKFDYRLRFYLNNRFFNHRSTGLLGLRILRFRLFFSNFFRRSPILICDRFFFLRLINKFFSLWNIFWGLRNLFFPRQFLSLLFLLSRLFWLRLIYWHWRTNFVIFFFLDFFYFRLLISFRNSLHGCFLADFINPTDCQ